MKLEIMHLVIFQIVKFSFFNHVYLQWLFSGGLKIFKVISGEVQSVSSLDGGHSDIVRGMHWESEVLYKDIAIKPIFLKFMIDF